MDYSGVSEGGLKRIWETSWRGLEGAWDGVGGVWEEFQAGGRQEGPLPEGAHRTTCIRTLEAPGGPRAE